MVKKRRINTSRSRRRRSRSPQSGDEVVSARDRLKGALLDLLPHSEEESESSDEERPWSSKSKRNTIRKKLGEKSNQEPSGFRQAFKMKLYDRTVDMSNYTDNTPLYPICRAWIANQSLSYPNSAKKYELSSELKESELIIKEEAAEPDLRRNIYKLPAPSFMLEGDDKLRVAEPIERQSLFPVVERVEADQPSREELLKDNLAHWGRVRQSWVKASRLNEERYSRSTSLLASIFYNSQKTY